MTSVDVVVFVDIEFLYVFRESSALYFRRQPPPSLFAPTLPSLLVHSLKC